jgi:hypothetical protein
MPWLNEWFIQKQITPLNMQAATSAEKREANKEAKAVQVIDEMMMMMTCSKGTSRCVEKERIR